MAAARISICITDKDGIQKTFRQNPSIRLKALYTFVVSFYFFESVWQVRATSLEVAEILSDPTILPEWWPSVYLWVTPDLQTGYQLLTKGWLPYLLHWRLQVVSNELPVRLEIAAAGDLEGTGLWTLYESDGLVTVCFAWRVRATKPLIRILSPIFRPIFAANHRWAMARGEESLRIEIARRQSVRAGNTGVIPRPPLPTWPHRNRRVGRTAASVTAPR